MRRRLRVSLVALAVLAGLPAGCGDDGERTPARPLGPDGLARAFELAYAAGSAPMHLTVTTARPGRGTRRQFSADGELDLQTRAGKATLHMEDAVAAGLPDGLAVRWTADRVTTPGGSLERSRARTDGGQLGMLPDETQALAELVRDGAGVRERGNGHWSFTISPQAAVQRGIPPQPDPGEIWHGQAWAAANGALRRVALTLPTPALGPGIPAGTATIELRLG